MESLNVYIYTRPDQNNLLILKAIRNMNFADMFHLGCLSQISYCFFSLLIILFQTSLRIRYLLVWKSQDSEDTMYRSSLNRHTLF